MPDPTLQATALRFAAGDLNPDEVSAFESRLADDQDARDALAEAVRLSAAAIGQEALTPHPSFRTATRSRLGLAGYRGHPLAWFGLGAVAVAACALFAVSLADRDETAEAASGALTTSDADEPIPPPRPVEREGSELDAVTAVSETAPVECSEEQRSVAEIWADLSNHDGVEKAHDDELRWRQRMRDLPSLNQASKVATDSP